MKKYAVIVAGGSGLRMGTAVPKQFLPLRGKPVLWHSLNTFLAAWPELEIILVLPQDHVHTGKEIVATTSHPARIRITVGGETRFHSVKNGLDCINEPSIVFVHDAVRCLISTNLIHRCYEAALEKGNAIPAIQPIDSLRIETETGNHMLDRQQVRIIQTPQTFYSDLIKKAFEQPFNPAFTDEASVVEKSGIAIQLIEGEASNIKITRPLDILLAEKILEENERR
ncbi:MULTISPECIES: 2-C-methyl-D-erythritol 4-phosphate cytidylyltransferase [Niastella]|uniref:2-C-methyl-D-erythritol 4-phosphate cytidylyltransferase n=1 Tax=Niastella soli TaxID=2821487 RepID=A0ABS3YTY7_9BACT|nr:2-C-methyl-D-erythritol 4-phosphate cytidylyltransferase [Niastella soli]MBO9201377.1 2-C-methyl-D-erythritol 4-phosphate cytidylyltransferase [Niastella soli]